MLVEYFDDLGYKNIISNVFVLCSDAPMDDVTMVELESLFEVKSVYCYCRLLVLDKRFERFQFFFVICIF